MSSAPVSALVESMRTPFLVAAAALSAACTPAQDAPKTPLDQAQQQADAEAQIAAHQAPMLAALDSGNTEFRAGRYDAALTHYSKASTLDPASASPYYGVLMVAQKTGRSSLADSATRMIRQLSGENAVGHADPAATASPHAGVIPSHPVIKPQ